jgi:hypothetical protein
MNPTVPVGTYKVRNEIETKRNEINENEMKRNQRNRLIWRKWKEKNKTKRNKEIKKKDNSIF